MNVLCRPSQVGAVLSSDWINRLLFVTMIIPFFQVHISFFVNERDQFRPVYGGITKDDLAIVSDTIPVFLTLARS